MTTAMHKHAFVALRDSHLQNAKELYGNKLAALDGDIGHVRDFYFDDEVWVIRYLIADTGSWLAERLVLLSPHAFGLLDQYERTLHVKLRKLQIATSPPIDTRQPVSRQDEARYFSYYGWPTYWDGTAMWGMGGTPISMPPSKKEVQASRKYHHRDDKHLRSTQEVTGYSVQAVDGEMGHVTGFLVDDRTWEIRELVVESGHWYAGKEITVAASSVRQISYEEGNVFVNLTKADFERTAADDVVKVASSASQGA